MDKETQHQLFADAVAAVGGQQAAARALGMSSDRSVRQILAGTRRLHAGILQDMARALLAHADHCRALERQLSPAFADNLTEDQATPPRHRGEHIRAAAACRRNGEA